MSHRVESLFGPIILASSYSFILPFFFFIKLPCAGHLAEPWRLVVNKSNPCLHRAQRESICLMN